MNTPIEKRVLVDLVYSPDDGGWYGEVYGYDPATKAQRTDGQTDVYPTRQEAVDATRRFAENKGLEIVDWTIIE